MTDRTEVESVTGSTFYGCAVIPETFDEAGYESTDLVWTKVGQVEDVGSEDSTKQVSTFVPVETAITAKLPGAIDLGKRTVMLGHVPADDGQALMLAAFLSPNHYSFKLVLPDGEVRYYHAIVTKFGLSGGKAGDVARATAEIDISKRVIVLPA